jgi:hypothetical protein
MALFQYSNGSTLMIMSVKALSLIPVWQGNRIIDNDHVQHIYNSVSPHFHRLDSGYQLIQYKEVDLVEKTYLIDGQHRMAAIKQWLSCKEDDFQVTVIVKKVDSEADAIQFFNQINHVKPLQFHDPNIQSNIYIQILIQTFPNMFRQSTKKPYLPIEKTRNQIIKHLDVLPPPSNWIQNVIQYNQIRLDVLRTMELNAAERKMADKMGQLGCALACDEKWVQHTLK